MTEIGSVTALHYGMTNVFIGHTARWPQRHPMLLKTWIKTSRKTPKTGHTGDQLTRGAWDKKKLRKNAQVKFRYGSQGVNQQVGLNRWREAEETSRR